MYDRLLFFLFISICITFINTDDKNLSEPIQNLDQLHDLVKLTTDGGDLTSEDFQWWATFRDKSDLELFVENKCQIPCKMS
uniref:Uncharacterized protein n=1 Tax=Acrobeloides nanus TaxID=290746 RepID=A0A914E2F9_9BILA